MTPFQRSIARDAAVLGVRLSIDKEVRLPSGRIVCARAYFPDFGAPLGTLIFHTFAEYREVSTELADQGYTCSQFGDPSADNGDPGSLREMLADWGWSSIDAPEPSWLKHFAPDPKDES